MRPGFVGIDVGSISTKGVVIDEAGEVLTDCYLRTQGNPIDSIRSLLRELGTALDPDVEIRGAGTTGSARRLAGVITRADIVKNEIIAHAVAVGRFHPEAQTVLEIGGQDSKIIILRDGIPIDFAMNNVCAAGTGSFLDHQAARLDVPIEEFGGLALQSQNRVNIAGRCTVFAESDMVHKAQLGVARQDIIAGLCDAIVRNYMNTVAKGKDILPVILFQGGVAANVGVRAAFERALEQEVVVPDRFLVMGAIGAALLAGEETGGRATRFAGFEASDVRFETRGFECDGCPNHCEVVETLREGEVIDRYGDRCGKWSQMTVDERGRPETARP